MAINQKGKIKIQDSETVMLTWVIMKARLKEDALLNKEINLLKEKLHLITVLVEKKYLALLYLKESIEVKIWENHIRWWVEIKKAHFKKKMIPIFKAK